MATVDLGDRLMETTGSFCYSEIQTLNFLKKLWAEGPRDAVGPMIEKESRSRLDSIRAREGRGDSTSVMWKPLMEAHQAFLDELYAAGVPPSAMAAAAPPPPPHAPAPHAAPRGPLDQFLVSAGGPRGPV